MIDPWASTEPGFEPYAGPDADDGFSPMDSQCVDLGNFLRAEVQKLRQSRPHEIIETVELPNGMRAQLMERATDSWELRFHLGRDYYGSVYGRTRDEVLVRTADAFKLKDKGQTQ